MLLRVYLFLIGFGLTVIGFVYIISYLNLFVMGYNFYDYVNFIIRRLECLNAFIGIAIITWVIYWPGGKKDELYL